MIMLGPIIGVAAMVSAVGLTESAKGELQAQLAKLGHQPDHRPGGRHVRVAEPDLSRQCRAAGRERVDGDGSGGHDQRVRRGGAAGPRGQHLLRGVPGPDPGGRRRSAGGAQRARDRRAVAQQRRRRAPPEVGRAGLGDRQAVRLPAGRDPHHPAQREQLRGRRGARARRRSIPTWTTRPLSPSGRRSTSSTRTAIPTSCTSGPCRGRPRPRRTPSRRRSASGGPNQVSTQIPSDVLQAAAQANRTLQEVALLAGLLALTVGGIGIANVMSISVIQRSAEIGIRRAVGHSRSKIAAQFLLESLFVGVLGGMLGAVLGVGVVYTVSSIVGLGRRDLLRRHPDLDGSGHPGVGRRRPVPVDQGGPTGAARDAASRLSPQPLSRLRPGRSW